MKETMAAPSTGAGSERNRVLAGTRSFFRAPSLPPGARRTYRYHLAYALLDAVSGGMALTSRSLLFLLLSGLGILFNTVTRPATATILRVNYPATHRGLATGEVRKWSSLAAFVMSGFLGRWFDSCNPWIAWAWIRFGWGLDPLLLAATPVCAAALGPATIVLSLMARLSLGSVQGGSWVLWWQIGVNYFAPPGEDTSRYSGILVFLTGLVRVSAPPVGAWILLATGSSRPALFLLGGLGVILSGVHALVQARRERGDKRFATMADFEAQFEEISSSA